MLDEEIRLAAFQLGDLKAPRPDGFSICFFQKDWMVVGKEVFSMVLFLLKEVNQMFIALIPKANNPVEVSQFRPIILCNFLNKIIVKCLANQLKLIDRNISPNQAAFVPGGLIQDSIIIAHKAFHYLNCKKKGKVKDFAFKIDLIKAYDKLERDFLVACMSKMGFAQK